MGSMPAPTRLLYRAALVIFTLTIVIGILNGTDIWDPDRNTLLTHVHSGTLGWLTLSIVATIIWMYGGSKAEDIGTRRLSVSLVGAVGLYVLAFWSLTFFEGSGAQRPVAGTLMFIVIIWLFIWAIRRMRGQQWTVPHFAVLFGLISLVVGAIFGVLLGAGLAEVGGVTEDLTTRMRDAHPGSMIAGYIILSGLGIAEWLIRREHPPLSRQRWGIAQVLLVFFAGAVLIVGFITGQEDLLLLNVPLEVVGIVIFITRNARGLAPSQWSGAISAKFARMGALGLVVSVILLARVIQLFVGLGENPTDAEFETILPTVLAFDHVNFILVMTNLLFGAIALGVAGHVGRATEWTIFLGVNIGVLGFAAGLIAESAPTKQLFVSIMGIALLIGVWTYFSALGKQHVPATEDAAV